MKKLPELSICIAETLYEKILEVPRTVAYCKSKYLTDPSSNPPIKRGISGCSTMQIQAKLGVLN